jgi:peptidoglycan/LPS O-acetylase OafA/YrhL/cytochrome c-type biogenesis protein CcmH/NrfG
MTDAAPPPFRLGYRPALDGFRAIAILLVILYHDRWIVGGFLGVDMFFVLSGLLITSILREEWESTGGIHIGRFYARRFLRLAPALIAFVASVYVATRWIDPSLKPMLEDRWAVAALLYATNLLTAFGGEYPLGAVSIHWSLAIEEQFYLLWPLGFRFLLRRWSYRRITILLLAASAVPFAIRALLLRDPTRDGLWLRVYFAPDTRADALLLGCALAMLIAATPGEWRTRGTAAACAGAAGLAVLAALCPMNVMSSRPDLFTLTALAAAGVLAGLWYGGFWERALRWAPLVFVGRLSYSLYLWHSLGLEIGSRLPVVGKIVVPLLLASTSYYLVERPFLKLKGRFSPRAEGAPREGTSPWRIAQPAVGLLALTLLTGLGLTRLGPPPDPRAVRIADARERLARSPQDPNRLLELGEALLVVRDFKGAASLLEGAHPVAVTDPRLLTVWGLALRGDGQAEAAARRFDEALRLDRRYARAFLGQAELALDQDRTDDAISAYRRCLESDPASADAHNGLGIAYAIRGDSERALAHFSEAARLRPDPDILANLEKARAAAKPGPDR